MSKLQVHMDSVPAMGRRFIDAWHRAERGELGASTPETHVTFLDLASMQAALSPKRLNLLRQVRQQGPTSIRALAAALERDYKNVHDDVTVLLNAGLLMRDGRKLVAPWDEVQASVALT